MRISHLIASLLVAASFNAFAQPGSPRLRAVADAAPVHGLIVQLREAPTHAALARERALGAPDGERVHLREQTRWRGVLGAMPPLRVDGHRAVGQSARLMRFERPMTAAQAQAMADQLSQRPDVLWAAPNTRERRLQAVNPPTDPFYSQQWWLQSVANGSNGAPDFLSAWMSGRSGSTGSASSIVAVLDSGIVGHPDLAGKVIAGYDLVEDTTYSNDGDGRDNDPTDPGDWVDSNDLARPEYAGCIREDSSWHGTAIAGILAASVNNGEGGASTNWPGRVLAVRVAAKCGADVADIVDGMRWAAGLQVCRTSNAAGNCTEFAPINPNPAQIINISFGGSGECTPYQGAINELRAMGVVVVAAAGNEHAATPTRPARCPGVIGVGALNRDGFKSNYSNFGSSLTVSTVGGDDPDGAWGSRVFDSGILAVGNDGRTGPGNSDHHYSYYGTSFSTPIVAGAISLMLAVNPALNADQIEQGLRLSARPHVTSSLPGVDVCSDDNPGRCLCTASTCGAGILDVPQALAYAAGPSTYVAPVRQPAVINSDPLRDAAAGGPDRPSNNPNSGSGGGGAMSGLWLLALGAATLALRRRAAR